MKVLCYSLAGIWLLFILACGGAANRPAVRGENSSSTSQDLWQRCSNPVMDTQCGARYSGDGIYRSICGDRIANQYFTLQSLAERQQFLIRNGCPPAMVQ